MGSRSAETRSRNRPAVLGQQNDIRSVHEKTDKEIVELQHYRGQTKQTNPLQFLPRISLVKPFLMTRKGLDLSKSLMLWMFKSRGSRWRREPLNKKLTQQVIQSSMHGISSGRTMQMELRGTIVIMWESFSTSAAGS